MDPAFHQNQAELGIPVLEDSTQTVNIREITLTQDKRRCKCKVQYGYRLFSVGKQEYGKRSKYEVQLHVVLYEGDWRRRHR